MIILFSALTLFYLTIVSGLIIGVRRTKKETLKIMKQPQKPFKVTVAIPARNEENHIINCLNSLLTPNNIKHIEKILVLNDDSSDRTKILVHQMIERYDMIECIDVVRNPEEKSSPKKRLITQAVGITKTDWLVLTDADCILPDNWISTMITHANEGSSMICGPVEFIEKKNWFSTWQKIEFAGMMQVSAGGIGIGKPTTCNAANMWIRTTDFWAVKGFEGVASIISGDDEFLMHKFHSRNPKSIRYVYSPDAVVKTYSFESFTDFLNQRKRWASKGLLYQSVTYRIFLITIWFYHFMVIFGLVYSFIVPEFFLYYAVFLTVKVWIDTMILNRANYFLSKKMKRFQIVLAQFIQSPYIVLAGFLGTFGSYTWKGVRYK